MEIGLSFAKSFEYDCSKKSLAVNQDININDLLKNLSIEDKSLEIEELKKNIQD
ncbi:3745_t:CDS:1, partial [Gigaspora rosea]